MKPPYWVLDTNVLVSGLLTPGGIPGKLIEWMGQDRLRLVLDDRILAEYLKVFSRPKFAFSNAQLASILDLLEQGELLLPSPLTASLPDPSDLPFLETAAASDDKTLVTGNLKHYPKPLRSGVRVLTPAEAWGLLTRAD